MTTSIQPPPSPDLGPVTLEILLEMCKTYSNWGKWGEDDQIGTLNFTRPEHVAAAAKLVRKGQVFSLSLPLGHDGPISGVSGAGRFNPIHLMTRDGADVVAGTAVRDFEGGNDRQIRATDDVVFLNLQASTHWDGLAHIIHNGKIYNGHDASWVTSKGALKNGIAHAREHCIGRGVLIDLARFKGVQWLDESAVITPQDLDDCCKWEQVKVGTGDVLLIRTGRIAEARESGSWAGYVGRPCAGLGVETAGWLFEHEVAAVATDTWPWEVSPSRVANVRSPLHIIAVCYMGLTAGEMFDLEALGQDCEADRIYDGLFVGPPLGFTGAVGSPLNPILMK